MAESDFLGILGKIQSKIVSLSKRVKETQLLYERGDLLQAYGSTLRLEELSEKMVLLTRTLPAFTGNPQAAHDVETLISKAVKTEIAFTPQGWFSVKIPALFPKKGSGSADYIRSFLFPAMRDFFVDRTPVRYDDCILIFRHVYDKERGGRRKLDHDNIEINMATDIVAMYVLPDDNPNVCSVFQTSAEGDADRTEIYVVPRGEFPAWLMEKGVCKIK